MIRYVGGAGPEGDPVAPEGAAVVGGRGRGELGGGRGGGCGGCGGGRRREG